MSIEQQHIIGGLSFELGKVTRPYTRGRAVEQLTHIDTALAEAIADKLGFKLAKEQVNTVPPPNVNGLENVPSLSLHAGVQGEIKDRVVAILFNDQVKSNNLLATMQALQAKGVHAKLFYSRVGKVVAGDGSTPTIAGTFAGSPPLTVDAVIVPYDNLADIIKNGDARYYLLETYKHLEPITLAGNARQFRATLDIKDGGEKSVVEAGSADAQFMDTLLTLMTARRVWPRARKIETIPV